MNPRNFPSPNFGPRRACARPRLIVLHYTAMVGVQAALGRLCDPAAEVSCHYLVGADGCVYRLVAEEARAWHAGAGQWGPLDDVNSSSIGIELDNPGNAPFAAAQMTALELLLADLMARWAIPPEGVLAHSDIAPLRKIDPGPRFDWARLARQGLAIWPDAGPAQFDGIVFRDAARRFGYGDWPLPDLLRAFRLRFRPWALGGGDARDMGMMQDLATRFPVDRVIACA
ncbi:N-acetylmuramoyl-L-alanine amidase [Rhodovulum imhoffii]|nr:N-acetylmuramoyl-L-alanine amidase [Rhodovulum imhoffii]